MRFSGIKETGIYVSDLKKTEDFYNGLLGLSIIVRSEGRHIFFSVGYSVLLCFIAESTSKESALPSHGAKGQVHFAFVVPQSDYNQIKTEIASKGVKIIHEESWPGDFFSFYFRDPDGNLLEVVPEGLWEN